MAIELSGQRSKRYLETREYTNELCRRLEIEDYAVQPSPEVSPPKWHLGHTSWLFEQLILSAFVDGYSCFNEKYALLFNSYYKSVGKHWLQQERGWLSRPTVEEIKQYRSYVDEAMLELLSQQDLPDEFDSLLEVGINHEQQHQELLLMDIKYIYASNPLFPVYADSELPTQRLCTQSWKSFDEGVYLVGHSDNSFAFDNEKPQHKTYIYPFSIAENLISNGEYLEFIEAQGYTESRYWLSQGWDWVNQKQIRHPLYWFEDCGKWYEYTLYGVVPLDLSAPVCHISYFEADAYASWRGYRLPTEFEIELYLSSIEQIGSECIDNEIYHHPVSFQNSRSQLWCWTSSQYTAYPRYQAYSGILEEYNGKFMCNQFVLRGGCVATPTGHYRTTYRNFYQPQQRWMFSGIKLAKDIE